MELTEQQIKRQDFVDNAIFELINELFLGLDEEPRLIGRQIIVPSGRLDMLYTYQKDFNGDIVPFLLMPQTSKSNRDEIEAQGIILQEYNPEEILRFYYSERLRPITTFSELKPIDVGIWNIRLINKFIYNLSETNSISELRAIVGGSPKTLYNKIRFADELGLLNWSLKGDYIALTKLGEQYVAAKDKYLEETLSEDQVKLLKDQVMQNPYNSCIIHSNYAIDLGLLAKNDTSVYLTPEGFKFVIQMQLHKSLKLMNYLNIN